ncbi:C-C motif chemokine 3-like 1 [Salarias fasciatus]|uniref:C-C motif chemokine 3-like 1 n=1 Tax=Salarias fasciatus TaxID=181472 RepID=A0A672H3V1_SALFA|nr:C-C motif chemokine 3-like 1 [Salarias fasciatus]
MKTTAALLLCLLAATLFTTVLCTAGTGPDNCCFIHRSRRISKKYIASYFMTDSRCPKTSAIFITKEKSKEVCVDPSEKWVQNIMNALDKDSF